MRQSSYLVTVLLIAGCATASRPAVDEYGTETFGRHAVIHRGPELEMAVGFSQATTSLGDEWLPIAVEFATAPRSKAVVVDRIAITMIAPDGRRLPLVTQEQFRSNYNRMRVRLDRAMAILPILGRYETAMMPCDRWFLVGPFGGFAVEAVPVNTFQVCSGPLVFNVPGGVQPGRWRLIVELEESRADIAFQIETGE